MKNQGQLHPGMGDAVLQHLQGFADLSKVTSALGNPECIDVVIAGQAVASAVSELFGDGRAVVYNDVDAFLMLDTGNSDALEPELGAFSTRRTVARMDHWVLRPELDYSQLRFAADDVYRLLTTRRQDLLNEVVCRSYGHRNEHKTAGFDAQLSQRFLRTFDLNCVQVGVRLRDRKLVWTDAFSRFLATHELLIELDKTPLHTAIRWFKKKAELDGVYGHDDRAMELVCASVHQIRLDNEELGIRLPDLFDKSPTRRFVPAHRQSAARQVFGATYRKRLDNVAGEVGRYFYVQTLTTSRIPLHTLVPRAVPDVHPRVLKAIPAGLMPTYIRAKQGFWKRQQSQRIADLLERQNQDEPSAASVYCACALARTGADLLQGQTSLRDLDHVSRRLDEHTGVAALSTWEQLTPWHLQVVVRALDALCREKGAFVYGFVDRHTRDLKDALVAAEPVEQAIAHAVRTFVETQCAAAVMQMDTAQFLMAEPVPALTWKGFNIRELRTVEGLLNEGEELHHCVGGYLSAVTGGQSAILAFRKHRVQERLTLELTATGGEVLGVTLLYLEQLKGLHNRKATAAEHTAAGDVTRGLNLWRLSRGRLSPQRALALLDWVPGWAKAWLLPAPHYPGLRRKTWCGRVRNALSRSLRRSEEWAFKTLARVAMQQLHWGSANSATPLYTSSLGWSVEARLLLKLALLRLSGQAPAQGRAIFVPLGAVSVFNSEGFRLAFGKSMDGARDIPF